MLRFLKSLVVSRLEVPDGSWEMDRGWGAKLGLLGRVAVGGVALLPTCHLSRRSFHVESWVCLVRCFLRKHLLVLLFRRHPCIMGDSMWYLDNEVGFFDATREKNGWRMFRWRSCARFPKDGGDKSPSPKPRRGVLCAQI